MDKRAVDYVLKYLEKIIEKKDSDPQSFYAKGLNNLSTREVIKANKEIEYTLCFAIGKYTMLPPNIFRLIILFLIMHFSIDSFRL